MHLNKMFESGVNPEGIQTKMLGGKTMSEFESGVNPEGIQTSFGFVQNRWLFESNSNIQPNLLIGMNLRVVLT